MCCAFHHCTGDDWMDEAVLAGTRSTATGRLFRAGESGTKGIQDRVQLSTCEICVFRGQQGEEEA